MRRDWLFTLVLIPFLAGFQHPARQFDSIHISDPRDGQALQGLVTLNGTTNVEGFQSAELAFRYADDQKAAWFLIGKIDRAVSDGPLVTWDTTVLTDGKYDLRLRVNKNAGQAAEYLVHGVRVRNYTPIETGTPVASQSTPADATEPSNPAPIAAAAQSTATPLPVNPAEITHEDIDSSMVRGATATLLVFIIIGCYLVIRRIGNRD
jgi:hypothetical protein